MSGKTRLVACNTQACRVEVQHDGLWGSVCDHKFDKQDALVPPPHTHALCIDVCVGCKKERRGYTE